MNISEFKAWKEVLIDRYPKYSNIILKLNLHKFSKTEKYVLDNFDTILEDLKSGLTNKEICLKNNLPLISFSKAIKKYEELYKFSIMSENTKLLNKRLSWYRSSNLPHTREYLIKNIQENPNFRTYKGIMLKEDFIEQYYESRKLKNKPIFSYDFSLLPSFIKNRHEKVELIVNEISTKTKKPIENWFTSFKELIVDGVDQSSLSGSLSRTKTNQYIDTELFRKKSIEKFGTDIYGLDEVNYVDCKTPVKILCKNCNTYYWQKPNEHLYGAGLGCPKCAMKLSAISKKISIEELYSRLDNLYGAGTFDYSKIEYINSYEKFTLIEVNTGIEYEISLNDLYIGKDPRNIKSRQSMGEYLINNWLNDRNIIFSSEVTEHIFGRNTNIVYIDFEIKYNNDVFWIEYNGLQHYRYCSFFHNNSIEEFINQVNRDSNIRGYCKDNNITIIEIPYTYYSYNSIDRILTEIIFNGKDPKYVIDYPKIIYPDCYTGERIQYGT